MKSNEQMIKEVTACVVQRKQQIKKKRIRYTALGVTFVLLLLTMIPAAFAARKNNIFDFLRDPASHITNLPTSEEVQALRDEIRASADPFSAAEPDMPVLLDRSTAVPYKETVTSRGYIFAFRSVIEGKAIVYKIVSGSIADGNIVQEETIEKKTFAMVDLMREDGADLTEEDLSLWFYQHRLVSGYEPWSASFCLACEPYLYNISYADAKCVHYLIDITDMLIFADHNLALAFTTCQWTDLDQDVIYADKKGNYAFHENMLTDPHALFYFDIPDAYADARTARKYVKEHGISTNFKDYYKD